MDAVFFAPESADNQDSPESPPKAVLAQFTDLPSIGEFISVEKGMSLSRTWKFSTANGDWALRWSPHYQTTAEKLNWVANALSHAHQQGAHFVPVPLLAKSGEPFVVVDKGYWEVSPWMPGEPLTHTSDSSQVKTTLIALGCFHSSTAAESKQLPISQTTAYRQRLNGLKILAGGSIDSRWPAELATLISRATEPALNMLQEVSSVPTRVQPVQVDSRAEHFLLSAGEVTGLIDFGAMRIDTPWVDIARLTGELAQGDSAKRDHLVALYSEATAKEPLPQVVEAFDLSGTVLAMSNWLTWFDGRIPENGQEQLRLTELRHRLGSLVGLV